MARSTKVRKGMPSVQLTKAEFAERFRSRFYDPAFDAVAGEIEKIIERPGMVTTSTEKARALARPVEGSPILTSNCR